MLENSYKAVVTHFGGQTATADVLGVTQPSVNAWVKGKSAMSVLAAAKAQSKTNGKFKATALCPELKEILALLNIPREMYE